MTWKPDICVYHFPCDDGFASAWIAKKKWPDVRLAPTNYGLPFPKNDVDGAPIGIDGENLLIADFSYSLEVLTELGKRAKSIIILDHHKTAEADVREYRTRVPVARAAELGCCGIAAYFDMDHSGAALTWNFCFPDEPTRLMIQFIEDHDLWRFKLKETRPFSLYLRSFPYDLNIWTCIADQLDSGAKHIMGEAFAIERFYDRCIEEMLPTATLKSIGNWKGVPVAHATYAFASDLAHALLQRHPDAPFAAVVVDAFGERTYSLRSEDTRQDVSEVAKQFGGGGHRNAAGFRVPA